MFVLAQLTNVTDGRTDRQTPGDSNRASAYGTPLDGATVKVVITTVNKT